MEPERQETQGLNRRLSHVESEIASILAKQDSLEQAVQRVALAVDRLGDRFTERVKPQWGVLISLVLAIFTIGGVYSSLSLNPLKEAISRNSTVLDHHVNISGHKGMQIRVSALEDNVDKLDIILQREMRLLDDATRIKIENLDVVLQREMRLNDQILNEKIARIDEKVSSIREEQKARTSKVYGKR